MEEVLGALGYVGLRGLVLCLGHEQPEEGALFLGLHKSLDANLLVPPVSYAVLTAATATDDHHLSGNLHWTLRLLIFIS